jgi:formate C-acetyltransferase
MNDRIEKLRNTFLSATRMADTERAVLITESYKRNEDKSEPMKRALALYHLMDKMSINIHENELLVGCHTQFVRSAPLFRGLDSSSNGRFSNTSR